MKKKVLVLMSTYNGEKYLQEQLDSILCQEDVEVNILIRDDGSTDSTKDIIKSYTDSYSNVEAEYGDNIGVVSSFNELLKKTKCDFFEYLAFADQDDCWRKEKLKRAINLLSQENQHPTLYCSDPMISDENLVPIKKMRGYIPDINDYSALIDNPATGCTCVFNQNARRLYLQGINKNIEMHDYWMFLCCEYMGKVIFDNESNVLYRQHSSNEVGGKAKRIDKFIKGLLNNKPKVRSGMLKAFYESYYCQISHSQKDILEQVAFYDSSFFNRIKCLTGNRLTTTDHKLGYAFKIRIATGKM